MPCAQAAPYRKQRNARHSQSETADNEANDEDINTETMRQTMSDIITERSGSILQVDSHHDRAAIGGGATVLTLTHC